MKKIVLIIFILISIALAFSIPGPKTGERIVPKLESKNLKASPAPSPSPSPLVIDGNTDLEKLNNTLTPEDFSGDYSTLKEILK